MTLSDLYDRFETRLYDFAMRLVGDPHRADDLAQETFIRAMGHLQLLAQLNPHKQRSWLFRTLKRLYLDEQLARRRQEALLQMAAQEMPLFSLPQNWPDMPDPFDLVPEEHRELIEKRYVLGMTSQQIARELGIPAATVRSRLHLAMKKIRRQKWKLR